MNGTGSVERILVGGILVVVLAILGIAGWNATGSGDDPGSAADGGAESGTSTPRSPDGKAPDGKAAGKKMLAAGDPPGVAEAKKQQQDALRRRELAKGKSLNRPTAAADDGAREGAGPTSLLDVDPQAGGRESGASKGPTKGATGDVPLKSDAAPETGLAPLGSVAKGSSPKGAAPKGASPKAGATKPATKPQGPLAYTVVEGDSLWRIAKKHYGDGDIQKMVDSIVSENPAIDPDRIMPGQTLKLPDLAVVPGVLTPSPAQIVAEGGKRFYEVRDGDTLTTIAQAELGARGRWTEIYELNRKRIPNPDVVHPGTTLILPKE